MIKDCNNCAVRKCNKVSRNDFPNIRQKPRKKADKLGMVCPGYKEIDRSMPFDARIVKNGEVVYGS